MWISPSFWSFISFFYPIFHIDYIFIFFLFGRQIGIYSYLIFFKLRHIKPIVIYCIETWTSRQEDKKILNTWESRVLKQIFWPVEEGNTWQIRSNIKIKQLYYKKNIINIIKIRRMQWLSHLVISDNQIISCGIINLLHL